MKINRIVRSASVLAAAAILVSAAGCADTSWSYKTSNKSITNGMWIYSTYSQVSTALSKIQEETGKTVDITDDDFSSKKVEKKKVYDWIQTNAKDKCIEALTYEKLVKDNKVKIDENTIKSGEKMYESYMGGASDLYDKLGISMKSAAYLDSTVQTYKDEVFKKLYDKEGTKAVSDDEVQKYFKENYTDYYYIHYSLKTTDDQGNSKDIDDDTKDKVTAAFARYATELNNGSKTPTEIDEEYKKDFSLGADDTVPSTAATSKLSDSNMNEDVQKEIKALGDKKADVKTIDDTYYLLYKGSINEKAKNITDDSTKQDAISRLNIVHEIKDDEFDKYVEAEKKKLKYDTNDACISKYSVERTVKIIKDYVKSQKDSQA